MKHFPIVSKHTLIWRAALLLLLATAFVLATSSGSGAQEWNPQRLSAPLLRDPIWVYNNWSAYDELSDRIPLTEELAMRELAQIVRLQQFGVHFDYYMMDAFWFDS